MFSKLDSLDSRLRGNDDTQLVTGVHGAVRMKLYKPKGLRVGGFRKPTVVSRFGDMEVGRRMCRDEEGKAVFALDERLRWKSHQQSSPSLTECVASVASVASFRIVARLLSALTAGVLSPMTIHRIASRVSQRLWTRS